MAEAKRKPRVVIVGAGMAGITAASKLHAAGSLFDVAVVEAGERIGGRILTSSFAGHRVEVGATWIHGIDGSPVHAIADRVGALLPDGVAWERMDGPPPDPVTLREGGGGVPIHPRLVRSVSSLYASLMDDVASGRSETAAFRGVGEYLRCGLRVMEKKDDNYDDDQDQVRRALFAIRENTERTYTAADDLDELNLTAEREYREFPGEQITIARGYSAVVDALAAALPDGAVRLGRKVERIEWRPGGGGEGEGVRVWFADGEMEEADHVIVTVSLGVLKAGGVAFDPRLPAAKLGAIKRLGFGLVNKLFLESEQRDPLPFLELAFEQDSSSPRRSPSVPWWMRRTASIFPVHAASPVLLAWLSGDEAAEIESLDDDALIRGFHSTLAAFTTSDLENHVDGYEGAASENNGSGYGAASENNGGGYGGRIRSVMRSRWRSDPLFRGSYSYVAAGSSGEDLDLMAAPVPGGFPPDGDAADPPAAALQILFAGEATHRTHYSTTHGAYFSGVREAERLIQYYHNNHKIKT